MLSPMSVPAFRALWIASAVSNIGTWMQDVGQGWLMTSLTTSPLLISLVSASLQLPGLVLALPAGVLADLADRRRLLLFTQSFMGLVAAALCALTMRHWVTPVTLLLCTAAMGVGSALNAPAWQALVPDLVPRKLLSRAVVWNGVSWNVARAVGPALGGLLVAAAGPAAAFGLNAVSFLATIFVLGSAPRLAAPSLGGPRERFWQAIIAGLRYARHHADLRAVISRTALFGFLSASGMALLPLVARQHLGGGASVYGALLGSIGAGALLGAALRTPLRRLFPGPVLMPLGMALVALGLAVLPRSRRLPVCGLALVAFGFGWLLVLSSANTAAQLALPVWVRARGLGIYLLSFSGAYAAGSAVAGHLTTRYGLELAYTVSAVGLALGAVISALLPLRDEESALDLTTHAWSEAPQIEGDGRGPVLVMVRYTVVLEADIERARRAVRLMASIRMRDGANGWRLYEDADEPRVIIEVFTVATWEEHLRQHRRGTVSDRQTFNAAVASCGGGEPVVVHLVAAP